MTDDQDDFDEHEHEHLAQPDQSMQVLDQLKKYQFVIRKVIPFLDVYEGAVLMQIVDRLTGWKKHEAVFPASCLYGGDKLYGGLARSMDRSRMNKALASLEKRNVIKRRETQYTKPLKTYWINYDVDLQVLEDTARPRSASANRRK